MSGSSDSSAFTSSNVMQEFVDRVIDMYDIEYIQSKWQVGNDESSTQTKRKVVKYNRQHAKECQV